LIAEIDRLLNTNTEREIADILKKRDYARERARRFDRTIVVRLR